MSSYPTPQPGPAPGTSVGGSPFGGATSSEQIPQLLTIGGGGVAPSGPTLQVWIPGTPGHPTSHSVHLGREGNIKVPGTTGGTEGQWGDPDTARLIPYSWTTKEISDFIHQANALGYKLKDFSDATQLWSQLVDEAARYGAVGRQISPYDVLHMHAGDNKAARGAQGPATFDETSARATLESAMQSELGRGIATPDEVSSFSSAANSHLVANAGGNRQFDPSEFAVEYLRSHYGSQSQAYRALGFYNSALSLLGGSGVPSGEVGA